MWVKNAKATCDDDKDNGRYDSIAIAEVYIYFVVKYLYFIIWNGR